jgi:hypothetical protein
MHELLPGLFRWTAFHEGIRMEVSSLFVAGEAAALVDPMLPEGGVEAVARLGTPEALVLTNRHHLRHSERFVEAFECPILCHEAGLHEFDDGGPSVTPFRFGDTLRPGVEALKLDAICAEETTLHIAAGDGVLAFADAIIRYGGEIGFVPDFLLGEDPERVKRDIRAAVTRLLELDRDFDTLVFAHGEPLETGGREALERFLAS